MSPQMRTILIRMVAFICVMVVGAALFMVIEGRSEKDDTSGITIYQVKQNFISSYNVSESDFQLLLDVVRNNTSHFADKNIPWSFGNSLYFSMVLITTIGYGHMTPRTWQGQLFCIFYSLFGIPITALMLKSVGEYITLGVNRLLFFVEKRLLNREPDRLETKCFAITLLLMLLMLIFGALVTTHSEDWTMMEGVYFTFVTLSTIGFGDYMLNHGELINDDPSQDAISVFGFFFLIVGLGVVSSVLCSISKLLEAEGFSCCKGKPRRNEEIGMERIEQTTQTDVVVMTGRQSCSTET